VDLGGGLWIELKNSVPIEWARPDEYTISFDPVRTIFSLKV
jgi:hypothetical protein